VKPVVPVLFASFACVLGCAGEVPADGCVAPSRLVDSSGSAADGGSADRCIPPGVQDDGCPAGTLGLADGTCQEAGVPPELCGEGFEADGKQGCEPILPAGPCAAGQMAVPGEGACHPVMDCGSGQWGDIPVDAATIYVDGSYLGGNSDGSAVRPWTSVSQAMGGAASGALVAIAAGDYVEDVVVTSEGVRIWGRCPDMVEIAGTGTEVAALFVGPGAGGTEVRGVAVTGDAFGIVVGGATDVIIEQVWVHDALEQGIAIEDELGPTAVTLRGSLVADNHEVGVSVVGAAVAIEQVVIRGTLPRTNDQKAGRGIHVVSGPTTGQASTLAVDGALVEGNHDTGVFIDASSVTLERTVVRDTQAAPNEPAFGRGVDVLSSVPGARATVALTSVLVDESQEAGLVVTGSDASLDGVVVRRTSPRAADQASGRGIVVSVPCDASSCTLSEPATLVAHGVLVDENHDAGVLVAASEATLEGVVVRGTLARASDELNGDGIDLFRVCFSLHNCTTSTPAVATVRGSLVENNHEFGALAYGSDATLQGVLARGTMSRADGVFGDGIAVTVGSTRYLESMGTANAVVTGSAAELNERSGLANWGATVALGATALSCNAFDLGSEVFADVVPFTFVDQGGNGCGCPEPSAICVTVSGGLAPPEPIMEMAQ
jgi:hypothetical protein